ncbi:MAG: hypothetical protein U0791_03040 [Gemmataceae bacterium]
MTPQQTLALEIFQFALDMVGIADPTGAADGISGLISLARGQFWDAAISGAGLLPYIGDLAKTAKLPKYVKSVAEAIKLASKDHKFAAVLQPALAKLKSALDTVPLEKLPADAQRMLRQVKTDIEAFLKRRMYNPNPKHELAGARGVKGTKLDLSADQAYELLNDASRCFDVPGKKQFVAVRNGKIYIFQPDGAGGFHAYPSTGKEIAANFSSVASRVAGQLGVDFKRLSRME